jgi:hypothetical protein
MSARATSSVSSGTLFGNYPFDASIYKNSRLGGAPVRNRWHNSLVGKSYGKEEAL